MSLRRHSKMIDGRAIQSERIRDLRLRQDHLTHHEIFIFVPDPGARGSAEAFISAREKLRLFLSVGFRCTICRASEAASCGVLKVFEQGKALYIIQRPLDVRRIFSDNKFDALNLELTSAEGGKMSALTETALRIIKPFILRHKLLKPSEKLCVCIVGSNGYFGKEICHTLVSEQIELRGIDLGDDMKVLAESSIVVSVVGKPNLITRTHLLTPKTLLIDVGYSYDEKEGRGCGDFHHSCYDLSEFHTPVPGGVGPLQILTLLERAIARADRKDVRPWAISLPKYESA